MLKNKEYKKNMIGMKDFADKMLNSDKLVNLENIPTMV